METGEFDEQFKQLDLLLDKCTKKCQEGIDKADKMLAKVRKSKSQKTEKSEEQED